MLVGAFVVGYGAKRASCWGATDNPTLEVSAPNQFFSLGGLELVVVLDLGLPLDGEVRMGSGTGTEESGSAATDVTETKGVWVVFCTTAALCSCSGADCFCTHAKEAVAVNAIPTANPTAVVCNTRRWARCCSSRRNAT